jgi:FtsP/CotA-like multicopper oxidase with cupredoxin domain
MKKIRSLLIMTLLAVSTVLSVSAETFRIDLSQKTWELRPGLSTTAWTYGGSVPGTPIVVNPGEGVTVEVTNNLPEPTNIHWHGLVIPNDQDGPAIEIKRGEKFTYSFTPREPGTYWYHPHYMPVLPQLDRGLYGAFIVRAPEDNAYSGDHVYILDDWYLDARGRRIEGIPPGEMERFGNVETVNGKTDEAIKPLVLRAGELHKLRFINASTAAFHTLKITGHRFRVTHSDGHPLGEAYETDTLTLAPSERIDAEISALRRPGERYEIASTRRDLGIVIPVVYREGSVTTVKSHFVPPPSRSFPGAAEMRPDYVLEFGTAMGGPGMMRGRTDGGTSGMMHGGMMHGGGAAMSGMMRWTINGRSFPDTTPLDVPVGKVVKLRFVNNDRTAMMGHKMDHPIHLHGTYFQIVSVNGLPPARETWKDTVSVPNGEYVDVAFVMTLPGDWMLHCHIIDHEDGGMMTMVRAR